MSCIQACGSAEAYHAKHKSVVNEIHNMAHNVMNKLFHEHGAMTTGCIKNMAEGNCIELINQYEWSGKSKRDYPQSIAKFHSGSFVHSNHCGADEAAVVYSDGCGSAWLLAWSVKDHCGGCGNPNKVHVETGPIENYLTINWCAIKTKLDASCDTSYYMDQCNGNEAFAQISSGNKAALAAIYQSYC